MTFVYGIMYIFPPSQVILTGSFDLQTHLLNFEDLYTFDPRKYTYKVLIQVNPKGDFAV
jgi:hypothetical protein